MFAEDQAGLGGEAVMAGGGVPEGLLLGAGFLVAVALALGLVPVARLVAVPLGVVDWPDARKVHERPVPYLGGAAVVLSLLLALAVVVTGIAGLRPNGFGPLSALLAGALVLALVGVVDDARGLPARVRFAVEVVVAAWVVSRFLPLGGLDFGFAATGALPLWIELAIGTFWVVAITNAFNMVDGLDGLCAGVGAVGAGVLAVVAGLAEATGPALLLAALGGALVGFLVFNGPPARIFLGDGGSLPVGFLLGVLALAVPSQGQGWMVAVALLALAVPAADLLLAVVRRIARSIDLLRVERERDRFVFRVEERPALFTADRGHLHHRLLELSGCRKGTLCALLSVSGLLGGAALWGSMDPPVAPVLLALGAVVGGLAAVRFLHPELRVLKRGLLLPFYERSPVTSRWVHAAYDGLLFAAALLLAVALSYGPEALAGRMLFLGGVAALAGPALFALGGIYRMHYRRAGVWAFARTAGITVGAAAAVLLFFSLWFRQPPEATAALLFVYFTATGVVGARASYRLLDAAYGRDSIHGYRTLIYGAGRRGDLLLREMRGAPHLGLRPVAFLDDSPEVAGKNLEGCPIHRPADDLREQLRKVGAEVVVISSGKIPAERLEALERACRPLGIRTLLVRRNGDRLAPGGQGERRRGPRRRRKEASQNGKNSGKALPSGVGTPATEDHT